MDSLLSLVLPFLSLYSEISFGGAHVDDFISEAHLYNSEKVIIEPEWNDEQIQQFVLGRVAAHRASMNLFCQTSPVLNGKNGEPLWGAGCVGGIANTREIALAVLSKKNGISGIGIDIMESEQLSFKEQENVLSRRDAELVANEVYDIAEIVSLKRSIVKALMHLNMHISFQDVNVSDFLNYGSCHINRGSYKNKDYIVSMANVNRKNKADFIDLYNREVCLL